MIDTSGHHIVYGVLRDYLSGEELPDTDDERIRQQLARLLVEDLGYGRHELETRLSISSCFNHTDVQSRIDFCARIDHKRLFILRYAPGSLVTRETPAVAAARILEPDYRIPLAIVSNGRGAELLETKFGSVIAEGMACIPNRRRAAELCREMSFEPYPDAQKREQALRILNAFDVEVCCRGNTC